MIIYFKCYPSQLLLSALSGETRETKRVMCSCCCCRPSVSNAVRTMASIPSINALHLSMVFRKKCNRKIRRELTSQFSAYFCILASHEWESKTRWLCRPRLLQQLGWFCNNPQLDPCWSLSPHVSALTSIRSICSCKESLSCITKSAVVLHFRLVVNAWRTLSGLTAW